jgi:hypothetical protein
MYCLPPEAVKPPPTDCTMPGKDVYENDSGGKLPCCEGLVPTTAPCRGDDMCNFCIPAVTTVGPRTEYPPAKISIDPATPQSAVDKHKAAGMSLILSDEFKDLARTKAIFTFEDIPCARDPSATPPHTPPAKGHPTREPSADFRPSVVVPHPALLPSPSSLSSPPSSPTTSRHVSVPLRPPVETVPTTVR